MSHARFRPSAEFNAEPQGRRLVSPALLSTLVALTSFTVVLVPRSAAADQVTDLTAQATAISQKLVQEQLEAGAYEQEYSVASAKVTADGQSIDEISQQVTQAEQQIDEEEHSVRKQALLSYVDAGADSSGSVAELFTNNEEAVQASNEYATIAAGDIATALDQLHTSQRSLEARQAALQQQETQDKSEEARQATALGQANDTESHLASLQGQVTGQLAVAIANQTAAQDAKAAAAVAAAQRNAVHAPVNRQTSAPVSSTGSGPPSNTGSGSTNTGSGPPSNTGSGSTNITNPTLNPYLRCVARVESSGNYAAVSPNGQYMGAFQFSQSTWNSAALAAGLPDLVGVPPNHASKAAQDTLAVTLYSLDGNQPWVGDGCS